MLQPPLSSVEHSSPHPLSPCSLLCPRLQLQQALLGNPQVSPAREAYRLISDIHLFLSSSNTNPSVLSPALYETTRCSLPPWPSSLLQWITQIHSFKLHSPNPLLYLSPQLQQAFPGSLQTTGSLAVKQEGQLQSFLSSSFLSVQSPSLILRSGAGHLLRRPLLTLCLHNQGTNQILVEHPAFLPPHFLLHHPQLFPIPKSSF